MSKRLMVLIGVILVSAVVGVGMGLFKKLTSRTEPPTPAPRVEEMKPQAELFAIIGLKAVVFRYAAADMDFWVELEKDGKTQTIGRGVGWIGTKAPGPNQHVEGYFVLSRSPVGDGREEQWTVAVRRDLVTTEPGDTSGEPKEKREPHSASVFETVRVWKAKLPEGAVTLNTTTSTVPEVLPTDTPVTLKTIKSTRTKDEQALEQYVVRVRCKVVTDADRAAQQTKDK